MCRKRVPAPCRAPLPVPWVPLGPRPGRRSVLRGSCLSLAHRRHRGGVARRQRRQYGKVGAQGCWMDRNVTIWAPVIREVDIWSAVTTWSVSCAFSLRTYPCVGERCPSFHPPGPGIEHRCLISGGIHQWCAQRARYYQLVIRSASFNTLGVCECARPPWLQGLTARSLNLTGDVRH